jgi:hypothetical protein
MMRDLPAHRTAPPVRAAVGRFAASNIEVPADAGDTHAAQRFEAIIDTILAACRVAADELTPFIPDGAIRLATQLESSEDKPAPASEPGGNPHLLDFHPAVEDVR